MSAIFLNIKKIIKSPFLIIFLGISSFIIVNQSVYFFQDDWYHLSLIQGKTFSQILNYFNLFQKGNIDPFNFYRPLSTKLYFYLAFNIFKLQPLAYLFFNALLFFVNTLLVYKIFKLIVSKKLLNWIIFFYVFCLANFTNFSYFTIVEPLILNLFALLCFYFYLSKNKLLSLVSFLLALTSRESALIIPLLLGSHELILKKNSLKKTILNIKEVLVLAGIYILTRSFIYGWPNNQTVYQIKIGLNYLHNLIKFLQWNLNITGLIKLNNIFSYLSLFSILMLILFCIFSIYKNKIYKKSLRLIIFSISWWLITLLPVSFFATHQDPWGLSIAPAGLALLLAILVQKLPKKLVIIFTFIYLINFLLGLNFYSQNHWTVQRKNLVLETRELIKKQCDQKIIVIKSQKDIEYQYAWYYQVGPKIFCDNQNLEIVYK
jgi:hypothetical protein